MAIEIDFGRELGRLAFPEGITDEQAQSYVRENYQAIRQGLLDRRRQELAAETESEEAAKFRAGEYGTWETFQSQAYALPQAVTEGIGMTLKGAERAATFFPPPTVNPFTGRPIEQTVEPPGPGALSQAGEAIRQYGREAFPILPGVEETIPAKIAGGVGSTLSVLPGALVGGPLGAGALYGLQAGEAGAEDADRVINQRIAEALAAGDYDTASELRSRAETLKNRAFLATAPIGAVTEGALGAAGKIPGMRSGAAGRSTLGKYSANLVERLIPQTASKRAQEMARGGIEGAVSEGLQESLEQTLGNMAAKSIYDPERGIMDGVAEAGFIGGASGGLVGGVVGSKRDINLANAVVAANGADPKNPLPLSNATVTGIEDTTPTEGYSLEPEITEEDVLRRQAELGIPLPESVPLPAPATPAAPAPAPTPAPIPAPGPVPTPAAATAAVSPETGLTADEQDELDQLIAVEDSGMLSEDQAQTLESYRQRLAIKAMLAAETTTTPENAVQEQGSDEGVLRREGSQVGLQEVDRGGRPAEGQGTQAEAQVQPLTVEETQEYNATIDALGGAPASDLLTPDELDRFETLANRVSELERAGWSFDEQAGWTAPGQTPAPAAVTPSPVIQAKLDPDNVVRDALQAAGNDPVKAAAMIVADLENITGRELRASYQEAVNRLQKMVQKPAPAKPKAPRKPRQESQQRLDAREFNRIAIDLAPDLNLIDDPAVLSPVFQGGLKDKGMIQADIARRQGIALVVRRLVQMLGGDPQKTSETDRAALLPKLRELAASTETNRKMQAFDAAIEAGGPVQLNSDSLAVGDTIVVGGSPLTITAVDPDTMAATADGGARYGEINIPAGIDLAVDQYTPVAEEAPAPAPAPAPAAAPVRTPRLGAGQTQGDLIASTQREDLRLVGEEGIDIEARQARAREAARQAAEAREAQRKAQTTMDFGAAQSAIDAIDKINKGLSENQYSDPLFLTPLAKLVLQIAKSLIKAGIAVDQAIRQAIAQAREQLPDDPTNDAQLEERLIRDAEYTAAVASGDMAAAQRMVDEAAKAAGYTVGPVWHGGAKPTVFNVRAGEKTSRHESSALGSFFSDSEETASQYGNTAPYFLRIENPIELSEREQSALDTVAKARLFRVKAKQDGFDGAIIRTQDAPGFKGGTEYVAFDPTEIKSADPITRDDQGNVVPLSQRFQSSTADIRGAAAAPEQMAFQNAIPTVSQGTPAQQTAGVQAAAEAQGRDLGPNPSGKPATLEEATAEVRDAIGQLIESITPKAGFTGGPSASDSLRRLLQEIPGAVLNSAMIIAQRVYRETRNWAQAVDAGMVEIMGRSRPSNVEDTRQGFRELLQGSSIPGSVPAVPPQPAAGQPRVDSRGYFRGQLNPETVANWNAEARRTMDSFGTDYERAFEWANSSDMGADAREWLLAELTSRVVIQTNSPNDIVRIQAQNLLSRITDARQKLGTQTAQAFNARTAAMDTHWWTHPILSFYNLVRDRQAQLPFPDQTSEQVRRWLQQSGRQAVEEVRLQMQNANNAFGREFRRITRDVLRREDINWNDILTSSLQRQGSMQYRLLEEILSQPGLRNLPPRGISDIVNLFTTAWSREQERIFRNEFRRQVRLPTVRPDTYNRIFDAIPRILRYTNIAMRQDGEDTFLLWNEAFRNAVAPQFGVASFDGQTARRLIDLGQRAQSVEGVNRNEVIQQMYRLMAREGGINYRNLVRDYWYAAVLSGLRTQVDNALNVLNGLLNTAMLAARAGRRGGQVSIAAARGVQEGFRDFWPILWRGELYRSVNFNPDIPGNALEGIDESRNLFLRGISQLKYVSRLMQALDHVTAIMTDAGAKAYTLARTNPALLETYMIPSAQTVREARQRAINEGTRPELVNKRTREIIEEALPPEVLLTARDIRQMSTFTEVPQGFAGALYHGINAAERAVPGIKFLSGTNFVRFASNYANELLNYFAPVALWRWYYSAPERRDAALGLQYTEARRDLLLAKLALGTALTGFAAALFLGDDDDEKKRAIDITGSFKSLSPEKRNQLLAEGRQPYSIRVGDTYISYRQMGFGGVLGAIGELRDQQLYSPDKYTKQGLADKLLDGFVSGALIIKDASSIAALTEFLGFANAYKYDVSQTIEKATPKYLARLAGSVIPNIMKEADAWIDSSIYRAEPGNLGMEYFLQQVPFARQSIGPGPILNVLGEPVQVERYPYSRWLKFRKEDKAWNTLGQLASKGVFMPTPNITVTVKENGERRRMNRDEAYTYQKDVGQRYRAWIERNGDRLLNMKPDDAAEVIDKAADRMRADAREKIQQKVRR